MLHLDRGGTPEPWPLPTVNDVAVMADMVPVQIGPGDEGPMQCACLDI